MTDITDFEKTQRRAARQMKCFHAAMMIKSRLDGSTKTDERLEHVRIAALGAVAEARAVLHAMVLKGVLTDREAQDCLDWGYDDLLAQIGGGLGAKIFEEGGHA